MARRAHGGQLQLVLLLALVLASAPARTAAVAQQDVGLGGASGSGPLDCEALGFTGLGLCSDCDQMATYVKDPQLVEECRHCCVQDEGAAGAAKFSEAVLEVCSRRIGLYPDVSTFVEEKASLFPKLRVVYRIGAAPKLIMQDSSTGEQEVVRIDNWKTENVEQFLREKLKA